MDHARNTCLRGYRFAQSTRPRGRVEHRTPEHVRTEALLGIADRFAFGMRVRVVALAYAAGALAHDAVALHDDRSIGLIAPAEREPAHRLRGGVPATLGLGCVRANAGHGKNGGNGEKAAPQDLDSHPHMLLPARTQVKQDERLLSRVTRSNLHICYWPKADIDSLSPVAASLAKGLEQKLRSYSRLVHQRGQTAERPLTETLRSRPSSGSYPAGRRSKCLVLAVGHFILRQQVEEFQHPRIVAM